MDVQLPDGTTLKDVPEGTTKAQIADKLKSNGREVPAEWMAQHKEPLFGEKALDVAKDVGSAVARPIAKAAIGAVSMVPDAAITVANAVPGKFMGPKIGSVSDYLTSQLDKATRAPQSTVGKVAEEASTMVAGGAGSALGRAARILPQIAAPAKEAEKLAVKTAEAVPENTKIENAKKWGFRILPAQGGGGIGKAAQGMSGTVQTEYALSRKNAVQADRLAGTAIGLKETQAMTPGNIERLKQAAYKPYEAVKKVGRIPTDDQFKADLKSTLERTEGVALDYPEDFNERVLKEVKKFDRPDADAASMLDRIKTLRERASRNMRSQSADDFELGLAQKKIATAMEDRIDRHVSETNPQLITDLREARVRLAKIYNVEDALSPSGHVSAAVLARQLKRGVPLSDELRGIAETYMEFPKNMRHPDSISGTDTPFSALDYLVGGVEAAANPGAAAKIAGALIARPIARGIITSKAYQNRAIKPRYPTPSNARNTLQDVATGVGVTVPTLRSMDDNQ